MKPRNLTEAERADETQWERMRLTFNQGVLDSLSNETRKKLVEKLESALDSALKMLRKHGINREIINDVKFALGSASDLPHPLNPERVLNAECNIRTNCIVLLDHFLLAPREVIRCVAIHEVLHLVYNYTFKDSPSPKLAVSIDVKHDYPSELWQEEQWVQNKEQEMTGNRHIVELWQLAVEMGREDWRSKYEEVKMKAAKLSKSN